MALANINSPLSVQGTAFDQMNPTRVGALHAMTRVPGMMDTIAEKRAKFGDMNTMGWDPREAMRVLNPRGYVRFDPNSVAPQMSNEVFSGSPSFADIMSNAQSQLQKRSTNDGINEDFGMDRGALSRMLGLPQLPGAAQPRSSVGGEDMGMAGSMMPFLAKTNPALASALQQPRSTNDRANEDIGLVGSRDPLTPAQQQQIEERERNRVYRPGTLSGSMHHGADFSKAIKGWYDKDDAVYNELLNDIRAVEGLGQNIGYDRTIDTSRGQDDVRYSKRYGTADLDRATTQEALARSLAHYGVQDMADIGIDQDAEGNPVFYNQRTGQALPEDLFKVQSKKNVGNYSLTVLEDGTIAPVYDSTFTATRAERLKRNAKLAGIASAVAAPFLPGIGAALGGALGGIGATAGTALAGAGLGALSSGLSGGNALKGAALGGLGAGLGSYLPKSDLIKGISNSMLRSGASGAIRGAAMGAAGAGAHGGNILKGALGGGLAGGIAGAGGAMMGGNPATLAGKAQSMMGGKLAGQLGQQLASKLVGSPFQQPTYAQPATYAQPTQTKPTYNLAALPAHARQRIEGALSSAGLV